MTREDAKFLAGIEKLIGNPIPEIALDGFAVSAAEEETSAPRESGRRSSARTPRAAAPEKTADDRPPRRARTPRGEDRAPRTEDQAPRGEDRAPRSEDRAPRRDNTRPEAVPRHTPTHMSRDGGRRRYRDDDDHDEPDNVVGFGDRIPAFLQVAPRPRRI